MEFDPATGQIVTVSGERKCAQDLGEVLLQDFLAEQNYGSFLTKVVQNQQPVIGEMVIRHYIAEAVKTLEIKQSEDGAITPEEKITQILQLDTILDDSGTLGFFIRVETESGQTASTAVVQPTALNHLYEEL